MHTPAIVSGHPPRIFVVTTKKTPLAVAFSLTAAAGADRDWKHAQELPAGVDANERCQRGVAAACAWRRQDHLERQTTTPSSPKTELGEIGDRCYLWPRMPCTQPCAAIPSPLGRNNIPASRTETRVVFGCLVVVVFGCLVVVGGTFSLSYQGVRGTFPSHPWQTAHADDEE